MCRFAQPVPVLAAFLLCTAPLRADETPRFSRHVVPLFSRLGCNAGACHGAVKGQGGFRLSLFGAEPASDHERLLRDAAGRRLSRVDPDASLLLLKATGQVMHQGGKRFEVGSREYQLLRAWIAEGAHLDPVEQSANPRLSVSPAQETLKPGATGALKVEARFPDGTTEDVTALCSFESRDRTIAEVDTAGRVRAAGVGDTVLMVRYRGQPAMAQVLVPGESTGSFPEVKEHNFIDKHVLAKLRVLQIQPAELCDDATFLRRASLDVTGSLPTPEEVRSFLDDRGPDKRARKIDELLARPGYAAPWATKLSDILRPGNYDPKTGMSEAANTRRFYEWVRARLTENIPYDQFVERILLATSREGREPSAWIDEVRALVAEEVARTSDLKAYADRRTLDLYWQRQGAGGVKGTLQVAHAFLGLRLECAQCHRHPFDVWQQSDLLDFANFFMRVGSPASPEVAKEADELLKEVKHLRDEAKKVGDQAKDKGLPKEEVARLQKELKDLNEKAKGIEDSAKRLRATEVYAGGKAAFASVTSTLGVAKSDKFRLLGEAKPASIAAERDPRDDVMAWLRRPDNPYFARAMANRVWAHYFGRGIIDPPDQLSPLNPPSHPELLQELSAGFVTNGYDLKWLHRAILSSRTYQQSARTHATSRHDTANYASFHLRRLPAEMLVDAINHATAGTETYPPELHLPAGARAMEVAGATAAGGEGKAAASLQYAFHIFGRPLRSPDVQCDCERDASATVVQTLYLANHPKVQAKIAAPEGRVARIVEAIAEEDRRIDEIYLWALSRLPTEAERRTCLDYVKESPTPRKGLEDVLWSLLNTREFLLNH